MAVACPSKAVTPSVAIDRARAALSDWRGRNGIVVYGAGAHTHKILPALQEHVAKVVGIADDSPHVWGRRIGRWTVCNPNDLLAGEVGGLLVSSDVQQSTMESRLRARYGDRLAIITLHESRDTDACGPTLSETGERQTGRTLEEIDLGHRARYFWALQRLHNDASVLDAACGNGYGSFILAEGGAHVLGVDVCEEAIRFARHHYAMNDITWRVGDVDNQTLRQLTFDHSPFDAVVSFETLEHLRQPREFLDTVCDLLRPGGAIFCSTPNAKIMSLDEAPFHRNHFETDEVLDMLASAGFASLRWFGQEGVQIFEERHTPLQRYVLYHGAKP